jgi:hypothetical protein
VRRTASLAVLLAVAAGCGRPKGTGDDSREARRIASFKRIAEEKDKAGIPLLITGLVDDDEAVRLFAARALRELTGQDFGYRADLPPAERAKPARRYADWLEAEETKGTLRGVFEMSRLETVFDIRATEEQALA